MKRDMDLIRAILLEVEKSPSPAGCQIEIPGRTREELYYHAQLTQEAGLIEARFLPNSTVFHVLRLTNPGHKFLAAARSDTVWEKAKKKLLSATGTITLEGLKAALPQIVRKLAGG